MLLGLYKADTDLLERWHLATKETLLSCKEDDAKLRRRRCSASRETVMITEPMLSERGDNI